MNPSWTEVELAYLAGIIDGEGCISLSIGKRRSRSNSFSHATQVYIGNTDARMIHWIHARFGGTVALRPSPIPDRHRPLWRWLLSGADIERVLSAVVPYLVIKREQALLVLEYRATMGKVGKNDKTPDLVNVHRAALKSQLAVLNRRGVKLQSDKELAS